MDPLTPSWTLTLWTGFAATLGAGSVFLLARWSGLTGLDIVRAVGVLSLRRVHPSPLPGVLAFVIVGAVLLPPLYALGFEFIGHADADVGLLFGAAQAVVAMVAVLLLDRGPRSARSLRLFLPSGDPLAPIVWLSAHLGYGLVFGYVYVAAGS